MNEMKVGKLFSYGDPEYIAPYKIEIHFGTDRSIKETSVCSIMVVESGKKLSGDGDQIMFMCYNLHTHKGCQHFISPDWTTYMDIGGDVGMDLVATCKNCGMSTRTCDLVSDEYLKTSHMNIAKKVVSIWHRLKAADIYVIHHLRNIVEDSAKGIGSLETMGNDEYSIYPYANIVKDLGNGADIVDKMHKFLTG